MVDDIDTGTPWIGWAAGLQKRMVSGGSYAIDPDLAGVPLLDDSEPARFREAVLMAPPEAVSTRDGKRWLHVDGADYELPDYSHLKDELRQSMLGFLPGAGGAVGSESVLTGIAVWGHDFIPRTRKAAGISGA